MRLLHARIHHGRGLSSGTEPKPDRRRDPQGPRRQSLPVYGLREHHQGRPERSQDDERDAGPEDPGRGGGELTWRSPSSSEPRSIAAKTRGSSPATATTSTTSYARAPRTRRSRAALLPTLAPRKSTSPTPARRPASSASTPRATSRASSRARIRPHRHS